MTSPSPISDAAARASLENITARALTDADWERERARLVEFVTILRDWNREVDGRKKCKSNRVVTMCDETCELAPNQTCESLKKAG
jgi:hypothetical protein